MDFQLIIVNIFLVTNTLYFFVCACGLFVLSIEVCYTVTLYAILYIFFMLFENVSSSVGIYIIQWLRYEELTTVISY